MARLNVNPTRMEQQKQKGKLKTARRGHKLLKDKGDEMIRNFLALVKHNKELRKEIEGELADALGYFMQARGQMTSQEVDDAVSAYNANAEFSYKSTSIMGLVVPHLILDKFETVKNDDAIAIATPAIFDIALGKLSEAFKRLIELANVEKSCDMLAVEIERLKRRINSLEYVMIPQTIETIKYIAMKLAEDQRSQQVRVMKVKEYIKAAEEEGQ
ncbi:MAG: V-type ATP synthase subunit D [Christensenellaceae bacterium]|jgi:V/A-type H+-transporting ATPase subunit D|nr:V-type ATP synthase subunit D [Christensenellaceae bacterium]